MAKLIINNEHHHRARSFPVSPLLAHTCTQVHRFRNATRQTLPASAKLTYLSVYDVNSRDGVSEHAASPSLRTPPLSRMYTGASVLGTEPVRRCLPVRN